jgi:hypothetical protein
MASLTSNKNPAAGDAAGFGENAFPGGNRVHTNAPNPEVSQEEYNLAPITYERQELPSFFELVTENATAPMRLAAAYLDVCARLAAARDYDGFCSAGEKFLDAGREFAELLKLLKKPSIISNEAADRLERKARQIHERAELFELEAVHMRAATFEGTRP